MIQEESKARPELMSNGIDHDSNPIKEEKRFTPTMYWGKITLDKVDKRDI
jgi:hypothetical protein